MGGLPECDGPAVFKGLPRRHLGDIRHPAQLLYHLIPARQNRPGFDAYIGRVCLGLVPKAHIRHLGIRDRHAVAAFGGGEGDASGHIGQYQSVLVKQVVPQGNAAAVGQGIERALRGNLEGRAEQYPPGGARLREGKFVVLKLQPVFQRNLETGVPAHTAIQGRFRPVLHLKNNLQRCAL